jgi:hypothetical protein
MTPDSKDLPRQNHPTYLAGFIAQFGILKIEGKEKIPRSSREKKAANRGLFPLEKLPITDHWPLITMFHRIQCVPATPPESNGSAQALLSILSTPPNSNDFKWMRNTTQAKKHNFPTRCLKKGANPERDNCHPKRSERTSRLISLNNATRPRESLLPLIPAILCSFESNANPQPQPNQMDPTESLLSTLSTGVNSNDCNQIRKTAQAKNHNFSIQSHRKGANRPNPHPPLTSPTHRPHHGSPSPDTQAGPAVPSEDSQLPPRIGAGSIPRNYRQVRRVLAVNLTHPGGRP